MVSRATPEQLLQSIVDGINTGDIEALMSLYEPDAAFAAQPGSLAPGNIAAAARRQADGSWRFVIDNPWGTD